MAKRINCLLQAISPISTVFSKDLYHRYVNTRAYLGKGLHKENIQIAKG